MSLPSSSRSCVSINGSTLWHCESKKQDTNLVPITSPNINRFSNFFFTDELGSKFENRLMFGEVMGKSLVFFFWLTV